MSAEEIQRIATGAGIQLNDPDTQKKFERWVIGRLGTYTNFERM